MTTPSAPVARRDVSMLAWWLAMLVLAGLVAAVASWSIYREFEQQRQRAKERLLALSEYRASQVESWLAMQMNLAYFLDDSALFAEMFNQWQASSDGKVRDALLARVTDLRRAVESESALLVDASGTVLARERADPGDEGGDQPLRDAVVRAIARGESDRTTIYQHPGSETPLRIDIVVPLLKTGPSARGAVVLRVDPRRRLFPLLAASPTLHDDTDSALWERTGDRVVNLSDIGRAAPADSAVQPTATSSAALARVLRGELPPDSPQTGVDHRGVPVVATLASVKGSDWWLVSQTELAIVDAPARRAAAEIGIAALALLFGFALATRLLVQRQMLIRSRLGQAEQDERLKTLALLQAIADSTSDSIFAKNLEGRYIFCNRAASAGLGRPPHELLGLRSEDVFDPETARAMNEQDARAMGEKQPEELEVIRTADGDISLRITKGPLLDADGKLIGMFGMARDVTQTLRTERALRDREAQYQSVVSVLSECIVVCDAHGEVTGFNPAAERLFGTAAAIRAAGACLVPGRAPRHADGAPMAAAQSPTGVVLAGGPPQRDVLVTASKPAGGEAHFEISAAPVANPDTGELMAVVTSLVDVTERVRIRAELDAQQQRLETAIAERTSDLQWANQALVSANDELAVSRDEAQTASRAKSAFVANMSHEIRTPMNAIIGLTHVLARDPRDSLQRERLDKIGDAAQHLLQVINDILDISKIEAGKLTLEQIDFTIDELMGRAFDMVGERAREKGIELVLDTERLPPRLRGDPTRLSQMLINLIANAVKFTASGWVRLNGELLAEEHDRVRVRFEVQDTGEGIEPARLATLFRAFEQGDNSTTRRHGGTGLGLSLTRQLALAMGGHVGVTSQVGVGSTFWVELWLDRARSAVQRAAPIAMSGLRALLVDDLPEALAVIGGRLQVMGLQVDSLDSGTAALRKIEAEMTLGRPYDVMLIDMRMDGMDGIQTLVKARELLGEGTPPSILVTAWADDGIREQALDARFDDLLLKPVTTSALHDSLGKVLRRQGVALPANSTPGDATEAAVRARHLGQRVLLAEDNAVNREVAEELISNAGLTVEIACDGGGAVELALSRPYDLILMDMQMPVMDGLEATRVIRERMGQGLPIIAMTANAFAEDRRSCLEAGMNDHVAKPVDPAQLYATLLRWLPLRAKSPQSA